MRGWLNGKFAESAGTIKVNMEIILSHIAKLEAELARLRQRDRQRDVKVLREAADKNQESGELDKTYDAGWNAAIGRIRDTATAIEHGEGEK